MRSCSCCFLTFLLYVFKKKLEIPFLFIFVSCRCGQMKIDLKMTVIFWVSCPIQKDLMLQSQDPKHC